MKCTNKQKSDLTQDIKNTWGLDLHIVHLVCVISQMYYINSIARLYTNIKTRRRGKPQLHTTKTLFYPIQNFKK